MATRLPTALLNARAELVVGSLDLGTVTIYTGTQPPDADAPPTGTLLAIVYLDAVAFHDPVDGVAVAYKPPPVVASAAGTPGWFRAADSGGVTVHDGAASGPGGGGQLELTETDLFVGSVVDVTAYTWTEVAS